MNKLIGLDVDDVVADLVTSGWLKKYNFDFSDNLTESKIKTWQIDEYTKIGSRMFDYLKDPSLYDSVIPVESSLWGVKELRKLGYRIVFVTAFNAGLSGRKFQWLNDWDFNVRKEDYIEAVDKSLILCDYLIDDKIENVQDAHGQGIVFTREWNKTLTGYLRVDNWVDIVDYFSGINLLWE